jgi:ParB-like chromosome segregation protein Spo0J
MTDALVKEGGYQVLPSMPPEQFAALKADIAERGVLTPMDVDEHGNILDGHHRLRACRELGLTEFPTVVRLGLTEEASGVSRARAMPCVDI